MQNNPWHYSRLALAEQVLNMFATGLSSSLVFFAPRRMGKTEFLLKDIKPLAEKSGWLTCYFSFLDVGNNANMEFCNALNNLTKQKKALSRIKKISGELIGIKAGIELHQPTAASSNIKTIIAELAQNNKILLLMDEIQILAKNKKHNNFIAQLRTALDIHKDQVKVIFTGSSREDLRRMFSQANAPFFHFGQNLPFPELDENFTVHLTNVFNKIINRKIKQHELWDAFNDLGKVPQLIRTLVEKLALSPNLTIKSAKEQLLAELYDDRAFVETWDTGSALEQLLMKEISLDKTKFFTKDNRKRFARSLGISKLPVTSVQSTLRTLLRKQIIGRIHDRGGYYLEDPNFKNWLLQMK